MASQPIVLEIDKLRTASGTVLNLDSLLPSAITPTGSVLTWTSSGFANDNSFAQVSYVDSLHNAIVGGASSTHDSLAKIEQELINNANNIAANASDIAQEAATRGAVDVAFLGNATINYNSFGKIENHLIALDTQKLDVTANAASATKWNNSTTVHLQGDCTGSFPISGNESDIYVSMLVDSSRHNHDANYYTKARIDSDFANLTTKVAVDLSNLKNDIIGGASGAYDTLLEIQNELQSNDSDISGILTTMSTKAPVPNVDTGSTEVLAWRSGAWVNDTTFAQTSYVDGEITGVIGGASSSADTLGKVENLLSTKAPEPPNGIAAGEFLRWDETNKVFTFATPAGGASSLATPPSQTSTNTFLYYDGTSWQYGTPSVASGAGTTVTSGVVQAVNNTTSGGEALSGSGYSSKGHASITTQLVNSMVLFMTSGTPQVNGEAHMYVHWRYRDTSSSPWSAYQDTGKILMRIAESYTLSEPREGAIAIHAPMRPAGAEIEYRVYFHVVAGTIYYPDNSVVSQLTNMTLMEVAI